MNESENRQKVIVQTSIIGIAANIVLSAFKAFVGFATNSIAVTLDAVNNLSDALSSVITIVGAKLSNKLPDSLRLWAQNFRTSSPTKNIRSVTGESNT